MEKSFEFILRISKIINFVILLKTKIIRTLYYIKLQIKITKSKGIKMKGNYLKKLLSQSDVKNTKGK